MKPLNRPHGFDILERSPILFEFCLADLQVVATSYRVVEDCGVIWLRVRRNALGARPRHKVSTDSLMICLSKER